MNSEPFQNIEGPKVLRYFSGSRWTSPTTSQTFIRIIEDRLEKITLLILYQSLKRL
jgi:hypothetical protein